MQTQEIRLLPSYKLAMLFVVGHIGAFVSVINTGLIWWAQYLILFCIVVHFDLIIRRYALLTRRSAVTTIRVDADANWHLRRADGKELIMILRGDSYVSRYLVILNLTNDKHKFMPLSVLMCSDSMANDEWRRLRRYLLNHRDAVCRAS